MPGRLTTLLAVPVTCAAVGAGVGAAHILNTDDLTEVIVTERLVVHREPGKTITVKGKTVRLPAKVKTRVITRRVNGQTVYRTIATTVPGRTITLPRRVIRLPGKTTTVREQSPTRTIVDKRTDTIVRTDTLERTTTLPGTTIQMVRTETIERETPARVITQTITSPAETIRETETVTHTVTLPSDTVTVTVTQPPPE